MTNSIAEEIGRIPMSPFLAATLSRAASYADSQGHIQVTIEHLLLALSEDPEATVVLRASNIDLGRLAADVSAHLGRIDERGINGASREVVISQDLKRILEAAAAAASQGRRREINGAIVLAAVIGEGRSVAAHMLRAQGMTFETAIKALQQLQNAPIPHGAQAAPGPRPMAPNSTDEILASARERVQTRTAPPHPRETTAAPMPPAAPSPMPSSADYAPQPAEPPRPTLSIDPQRPPQNAARPEPALPPPPAPAPQMRPPQEPSAQSQSYEPRWEPAVPRTQPPAQPQPAPAALPQPQLREVASAGPHGGPATQPSPFDAGAHPAQVPQAPPQPDQWAPRTAPPVAPPQQRPPARMPPPIPPAAATPPMPAPGQRTAPPQGAFPPPSAPGQPPSGPGGGPAMQPPAAPPWAEAANAPPPQGALPPRPRGTAAGGAPAARTQPPMAPQQPQQPDPRRRAGPIVQSGQLVENIPRNMRAGITMIVEARLAKAEVKAIAEGLQGGGVVHRHEVLVSKAMTVRLRAPEGGFTIETASPETQWIDNVLGIMADDYASWRWAITPLQRGKRRLQLVVSARTVGADGLTAETALPDQVIEVKVTINYAQTAKLWAGWIAAAILGGVLARFGETAFALFAPLFSKLGG